MEETFTTREGGLPIAPVLKKITPKEPITIEQEQANKFNWSHLRNNKEQKKPLLTRETLKEFCTLSKITIRYNIIAKEIEIFVPTESFPVENQYSLGSAYILSALKSYGFDLQGMEEILLLVASEHIYNPIADWIKSKKWDGVRRFKALCDTIEAENNEVKQAFLYRWMLTAVAAAFEPEGIGAAGMLVLQGNQHIGKTYWLRQLLPQELRHFFKSGLSLDPREKDSVKAVVSHFIVELGELDSTFRKSDIAALKAFITDQFDVYRPQYARRAQKMPRRTILAATVNPEYFLADTTGNRRFWTIACKRLDSRHTLDMQQIWAEIYEAYLQGEKWDLTPAELALVNTVNEEHQVLDYITEKTQGFYDWTLPCTAWKSAAQIADQVGFKNPSHSELTKIGQVVLKMNGGARKRTPTTRLLAVPDINWTA